MSRRQVSEEIRSMLASLEEDIRNAEITEVSVDPDQEGVESIDTDADKPSETAVDSVDTTAPTAGTTGEALTACDYGCEDDMDSQIASVEALITAAEKEDEEEEEGEEEDGEEDVTAMIAKLEAALAPEPKPAKSAKATMIASKLDKMADALQAIGRQDLAERVDVVSNFLEAHADEIE